MGSDSRATAAPSTAASSRKVRRLRDRVRSRSPRRPRACCRADRLDTAAVSPTAVSDSSTEYTGMIS